MLSQSLTQLIHTHGQGVVGGETTGNSFQGSLLDGFGDGGIGVEHICPCHDIAAGLLENACAFANVCLADVQKQTALQTAEAVIHFALNIHIYFPLKNQSTAIASISHSTFLGRVFTAQQLRAGLLTKYFA